MGHRYRCKVPAGVFCASKRAQIRKAQRALADQGLKYLFPARKLMRQKKIEEPNAVNSDFLLRALVIACTHPPSLPPSLPTPSYFCRPWCSTEL